MKLFDVSVPLTPQTPIWSGHTPFEYQERVSSTGLRISSISFGSHIGTHIDAPNHSISGGAGIEIYPLDVFIGPCLVLDMNDARVIDANTLGSINIPIGGRILFKTRNSRRGLDTFFDDYVYIEPDAAEFLASRSPKLIGTDGFSVVQAASTRPRKDFDNRTHDILLGHQIAILEGLNLAGVEGGDYFLIAPPLPVAGIDGCPVRAVLIRN